jgi:hypothetical protein
VVPTFRSVPKEETLIRGDPGIGVTNKKTKLHHRPKPGFPVPMEWFPELAFERDQQPKVPSPLDEVMAVIPNGH